ncbi:hypothetical protein OB919_11925 [Halobacteria archaeon AArc-curdl1]|uniref:DUF1102 domain-containing protein n=1 Tax=Natronosalvus hydrolyticus TaxID=2979988 RepID=A0AAP2ZAY0_9EURY|nr:hypothetical protein [Halobacteria archaeon AArc-curdl1]
MNVADDSEAFLAIKEGGANPEYVDFDGEGRFEINIDENTDATGAGVNPDSYTIIRDAFEIHNQGTQEVQVWMESVPEDTVALGFDSTYYDGDGNTRDEEDYGDASTDINVGSESLNDQGPDPAENWEVDHRILVPEGEALLEGYILVRGDVTDIDEDVTVVAKTENEIENY